MTGHRIGSRKIDETAIARRACADLRPLLRQSEPGEWMLYHVGDLMLDCERSARTAAETVTRAELCGWREAVWEAYEKGRAILVQRRVGWGKFEYYAIRTLDEA